MVADPLTKHMVSGIMQAMLETGCWVVANTVHQKCKMRTRPQEMSYSEDDLLNMDA